LACRGIHIGVFEAGSTEVSEVSCLTNNIHSIVSQEDSSTFMIIVFMQVDFYQFSISWSRILPIGLVNVKNPAGIYYYNQLINELLKNNIEPMVSSVYQMMATVCCND
jgi:hypothetical protein